jgi:hypothetical protein
VKLSTLLKGLCIALLPGGVDLGCVLGDDEEEEVKTDPHSSNAFISAIRGLMPATVEMDEWCKCIAYELDNVRINFVAAAQREAHAESLARIEELEAALEQISEIYPWRALREFATRIDDAYRTRRARQAMTRLLCAIFGCRDVILRPRRWTWLTCSRCFRSTWWK